MSVAMWVDKPREVVPAGLKNGGHVCLSCSNCHAGLMDIWLTRPDEIDPLTRKPFEWEVQASCPFCGDKSFTTTIHGGYHISGFGLPKPDDEDETIPSTQANGEFTELDNGVLLFHIEKYSPDAKPQKVRRS